MISKGLWFWQQLTRRLWVRAGLFVVVSILSALLAVWLGPLLPYQLQDVIGAKAVDTILSVLTGSMLAVTTFAVGVMVSALSSATQTVTPRATELLISDGTNQNALGTFLGTFLFSLVGLIGLKSGYYGPNGRVILYLFTLGVVALVTVTILRWIEHLVTFGRVADTTMRVEAATRKALLARGGAAALGANPLVRGDIPAAATPVHPREVGYVRHFDLETLSNLAAASHLRFFITCVPGTFVHPGEPFLWVDGDAPHELTDKIDDAFTINDKRAFDHDPRFGFSVLAEVASRALSPGINDPGTAIDVIGRAVRLLELWSAERRAGAATGEAEALQHPRLWISPIRVEDFFDDVFAPIARDGASVYEVGARLLKALRILGAMDPTYAAPAAELADRARLHADAEMTLPSDRARMAALASDVAAACQRAQVAARPAA